MATTAPLKPSLETLPSEVVEKIARFLPPRLDLGSFRLTNREIRDKIQGDFIKRFHHREVPLGIPALEELRQKTEGCDLGGQVRHCTINCLVYCTEEKFRADADERLRLLTAVFSNIKSPMTTGTLHSLSFKPVRRARINVETKTWQVTPPLRGRIVETTMMALERSGLSVDELDLSLSSEPGQCLHYDEFLDIANKLQQPSNVFSKVKIAKLKLASPRREGSATQSRSVASILHQISNIMPTLERLELSWIGYRFEGDFPSLNVNLTIGGTWSTGAKSCYLYDLIVSESVLLRFVESFRPTRLEMKRVRLVEGTKASVLSSLEQSYDLIPDAWGAAGAE
ncbi:hypothetical protein F5Y10DRAFT_270775 [Nemania abortiva]|nr:hypothetical protein F5Y10DRAFT_270775 [Nemania abortiva]